MRHLIESLNTQIFYCDKCNTSIPVVCDYSNIKNVMVHSDVDIEFELIARVKCPNCSQWTSIILHFMLEESIVLLNKYKYTTIYSNIDTNGYISIKFKKGTRISRKIRNSLPIGWKIYKGDDKCYILYTIANGHPDDKLVKLIDLEHFIRTCMANKGRTMYI